MLADLALTGYANRLSSDRLWSMVTDLALKSYSNILSSDRLIINVFALKS